MVASFRSESVVLGLDRFTERIHGLAAKLKRAEVDVVVEPSRSAPSAEPVRSVLVRLHARGPQRGRPRDRDRRGAGGAGKPPEPRSGCAATRRSEAICVVVQDDGRGIDWTAVAAKARSAKLPSSTHEDLVNALFADAFTTRDVVTETSGRGMGLSVVREVVRGMGGRMEIESASRKATLFRFVFPPSCLVETAALTAGTRAA